MLYLVDTDVLVDLSRNNEGAVNYIDSLRGGWTISIITALEFVSGAKTQREAEMIDRLIEAYATIPCNELIGQTGYSLLKLYSKSHGLRTFDALIAATAMVERRTLAT